MIVVGIEGPSYSGKSTLAEILKKELSTYKYNSILFPCYMEEINITLKRTIPLNTDLTIEEELKILDLFLQVEKKRKAIVSQHKDLDFVILDRTIFSLLAHNYSLEMLTGVKFYEAAYDLIIKRIEETMIPEIYIYVDTAQNNLNLLSFFFFFSVFFLVFF